MDDLISRAQIEHERDLVLDQARKAMPCTGEDEELDHGARMYRAGIQDLARRLLALPAASQPEAEPVAWQQRLASGGWGTILHGNDKPIGEARPLYATPAPVVPAEELDALVDGWDTLKDNLPPDGHSAAEVLFDYGDKLADAIQALRAQQPAAPVNPPHEFYLGTIDKRVAELSDTDVWQLCLDGDEFERAGMIGDCLLRREAEAWLDRTGLAHDHVAMRMIDFAHAAHKRRSIQKAAPVSADIGNPITMIYRNYRGEVAERTVIPHRIWWGSTDWHPESGWLMSAYDPDKGADRDFALTDCDFRRVAPVSGVTVQEAVANDPHCFVVVSADYSRPFLLGAYPTLGNAVKAQCGSPEKWHIFERHLAHPTPAPLLGALVEKAARHFEDQADSIETWLNGPGYANVPVAEVRRIITDLRRDGQAMRKVLTDAIAETTTLSALDGK